MWQLSSLIISVLANLLLGLLVLAKNAKSATNRFFLLTALSFCFFAIVNYVSVNPVILSQLTWIRLDLLVGVFLFLFVYLTFDVFPDFKFHGKKTYRVFLVLLSILTGALTMSPFVFSKLSMASGGVQPVPAPGIAVFAFQQAITLISAIVLLVRKYRTSSGIVRQQFKYIILGISLALGVIVVFNLIFVTVLQITAFVPLVSFGTIFFSSSFAYAIIRTRLLNIRVIVARSVAYGLMLVTVAVAYGLLAFEIGSIALKGNTSFIVQEGANIVLAIVIALTFQPVRKFFEKTTDRIFYRERYDSQVVINNVSKILVSELDLNRMLKRALTELCDSLKIQFGQIIVFNNDRVYRIEHYGPLPKRLMIAPELRLLDRPLLIVDELPSSERRHIMERHGIRVSLNLKTREDFVGYILLGDKLAGDIYSSQDIELLEIISKELAVAIQNAKAYDEIQAFNLTLQARVDHATNRLRVANRHLKDLDRAKDEFISMASHQLRTPLTTVKGYLSMMLEGDVGKLHPNQKEFVQYAFDASERMVNLISDLLNVSRLSAGRFLIQTKPTDMVAMISDEVRQLQNHAKQKGISLVFEPPKEPLPPAEIDDNKTRQVVMNFIDNAIYYTQHGQVRVVLEQTGNHVRLEVRDSGIGVPEDAKKKLFSKFFRAGNAQTVRPDGTGLGLYLAKRVVEDQNGTIIFNSVEGKGSTFGFELPFTPPKPVKKKHEENSGHPAAHK